MWTRQWELKLIRIKLMRVNLPSVNAALPVVFCSEIKFPYFVGVFRIQITE